MNRQPPQSSRQSRRATRRAMIALAAGGGLVVLAALGWPLCPAYLRQAFTHRWFVIPGLIALGCAVLIAWLSAMLWRAGQAHRGRPRTGEEGQAVLEFALVLPILLMLALVMVQSSLLMAANVNLHYSAYCAARAAIVAIPLQTDAERAGQLGAYEAGPGQLDSWKMARVYTAAVWALMPYSCGANAVAPAPDGAGMEDDLSRLFAEYGRKEPRWARDYLSRKLQYSRDHTWVYVDPPRAEETIMYAANADVHVRVKHDLYLAVPYANRLFWAASKTGVKLDFGSGEYALEMVVSSHLTIEGVPDFIDIEEFPQPGAPPLVPGGGTMQPIAIP